MDMALQAKLLRVLQEKEVERLGGHHKIKLNVRILATTHRKLKERVEQGLFREDLYYRVSVFPINIPSLKERVADILPLAKALSFKHKPEGKLLVVFTEDAVIALKNHDWSGNVRELENVVQRALILQQNGQILAEHLVFDDDMAAQLEYIETAMEPEDVLPYTAEHTVDVKGSLGQSVRSTEYKIILQTLKDENGSRETGH